MSQSVVTPTKTIPHPGKSALRSVLESMQERPAQSDAASQDSPAEAGEQITTTAPRRRANRDQE